MLFVLVYATMRNLDKKQRLLESVQGLHKDTLAILQMDITDQHSIVSAHSRITEGRVDILGKQDRKLNKKLTSTLMLSLKCLLVQNI